MSRCISLACGRAQEMERRKYDTEAERDTLVPVLRDVSRQEYLKKREEGKLEELRQALEDEEALFAVRARPRALAGPACSPALRASPRAPACRSRAGRLLHAQAERQVCFGFQEEGIPNIGACLEGRKGRKHRPEPACMDWRPHLCKRWSRTSFC